MQINLLSPLLLLTSLLAPGILASANPAPHALANPNPKAHADFQDIGDSIDKALTSAKDALSDTVSTIKDKVSDWATEVHNWKFPNITSVPEDVKGWFSDAERWFDNFPAQAWDEIRGGVYPPEVSQWVQGLPEKMREEARTELKVWAESHNSGAPLRGMGMGMGWVGVAGVVAVVVVAL